MKNLKICTPVRENTQRKVLKRLRELKGKTDMAEIWLDHIEDLDIKGLLSNTPLPVICVCKKPNEGGKFKGTHSEIARLLSDAAKYGAEYIDLPIQVIKKSNSIFDFRGSILISSFHDFKKTPSLQSMLAKARGMKKRGADIVKIAVTARSFEDTFTLISLAQILQDEKIPHILIAMGKKGTLSRVLTPFLGGAIMFAPLSLRHATANGQLTVKELREAWELIV